MMRKDARVGARDQIILYMLLSPLLLGLMLALVMPMIENAGPQFVVSEGLVELDRAALEAHGEVELVDDREAVERRVLARDDITGVVPGPAPGELEIIVEGDEPEALWGLGRAIIEHDREVRGGTLPDPAPSSFAGADSTEASGELRLIATGMVAYCVTVIVGLMIGFAILDEKINGVHVAYDVSPLRFFEYLGAKLGLGVGLALVLTVPAIALPLGFAVDWGAVLVGVLASVPFAFSLGLCVGAFARDQLGAVAVMKALLPVWTSLPILGFVLPDSWLWTQFPFANHWGVQGLVHALGDGLGVWTHAGLNLLTGLPVLVAAAYLLRRKLGFT